LDGPVRHGRGAIYLRSFASVYVLVLTFEDAARLFRAREAISNALPEIESLTVALPPPDGPDASGGAGFGSA
jgi:hypothetical protein